MFIYKNKKNIKTWDNWGNIDCPEWWTVHNKLKHKRMLDSNYKLGNFKYVKEALAGLYVLSRILHNEYFDYELYNKSKIFKMVNWSEYGMINEDEYLYYDD